MRRGALAFLLALLAGCDFTMPITSKLGIEGRYRLLSIDGAAIPQPSGSIIIDSAFFEVRDDDEIYFVDHYQTPVSQGIPTRGTSTALYKLDETEGGGITTIPRDPFDDVPAMLFSRSGSQVVVEFTVKTAPTTFEIVRRVYTR